MTLGRRRIIYIGFFAIFIILAPIIILYSTGYSYNFKKNKLEKTGIIFIESNPKNAQVYIDGKLKKNKTPARFTRMLPGTYKIEVRKDGYHSWSKEMEVKSNLTTFNRDIIIFKKSLPINIADGQINILTASPDQKKIVYSIIKEGIEELRFFNLNNNSDFLIQEFSPNSYNMFEFIEWSPSQNKVLLKQALGNINQYLIVDTETLKIKELSAITRINFERLSWDQGSDNFLYGLRQAVLHRIDIANNTDDALLSANISDFWINGNEILYITELAGESFLNREFLDISSGEAERIKLPSPSEYTLENSINDQIVLLDKRNSDLFIIKKSAFNSQGIEKDIILQDKAKELIWSENGRELLYYTDFEIWIFDAGKQEKKIVTRYGEVINQALWHPEDTYVIYQVGNSVRVIETVDNEMKNDLELTLVSNINSVLIDDSEQNIYFGGRIGNQQGLYRLEIQ
ncbi:PEGA domain-containing protein [Candidatus Falkowbacteria bacterium]|nr:PEGA domain-containing protein [Candidatus Falkowbacteria bacterium]